MNAPYADNTARSTTLASDLSFAIKDETFCTYVTRLKDLHNFLYQEAVPVADAAALEMGNLNALYLHPDGRAPTVREWNQVERQTQALFLLLTPALRRKFLMGGTPSMVAWLPVYFLGLAAFILVFRRHNGPIGLAHFLDVSCLPHLAGYPGRRRRTRVHWDERTIYPG